MCITVYINMMYIASIHIYVHNSSPMEPYKAREAGVRHHYLREGRLSRSTSEFLYMGA